MRTSIYWHPENDKITVVEYNNLPAFWFNGEAMKKAVGIPPSDLPRQTCCTMEEVPGKVAKEFIPKEVMKRVVKRDPSEDDEMAYLFEEVGPTQEEKIEEKIKEGGGMEAFIFDRDDMEKGKEIPAWLAGINLEKTSK